MFHTKLNSLARFAKVDETYEYIKKLLEASEDLAMEAQSFFVAVKKGTKEQVVASAKLTTAKGVLFLIHTEFQFWKLSTMRKRFLSLRRTQ